MIPKIIHYCWVGGRPNALVKRCVASWRKYCPDWEIREWNERNIPVRIFPYLREAFNHRKFSNVSNFIRIYAVYNHGGVYLDSDVELIKGLEGYLAESCFFDFDPNPHISVNDAVMGAVVHHPFIKEMIEELLLRFDGLERSDLSGPGLTTDLLLRKGLDQSQSNNAQPVSVDGITIFPSRYFHPYAWNEKSTPQCVTPDTCGIHRYAYSWADQDQDKDKGSRLGKFFSTFGLRNHSPQPVKSL